VSQGQRFRRRALRRGYKVDEVDAFLDRVEATLAGGPIDAPVAAQEVHDVVFRVRFGGYDEWQVDLHLDRVERQLAELEDRGGFGARGPESRMGPPTRDDRMAAPPMDRMGPPPMGPPDRMGPPMGAPDRMGPPPMGPPDRMGPPMGDHMGPPDRMGPPVGAPPPMREERMPPPMPARPVSPMAAPPGASMGPPMPPPREPSFGRFDEPTFAGFEPARQSKADMTAEIRMGDPGFGPPMPAPVGAPGPGGGGLSGEALRIDQMRRTFQPRRFGSGYDPGQVDRLFEGIISAVSGRGPGSISEAELDPGQFNLVPGGYFEAEVDNALREVRDILRRH
jgi:DivIVA domain-containing protein